MPLESNREELVTVYRSMDVDAKDDGECIVELLEDAGIHASLLDDSASGVPEGVFEVRVAASDAPRAEELIAQNPLADEVAQVDDSHALDQETIASAASEMEAMSIKNLLDSSGIAAVLVGDSVLPNFPFEVRVAHDQAQNARVLIADAEKTGPAGAEEAERATEPGA